MARRRWVLDRGRLPLSSINWDIPFLPISLRPVTGDSAQCMEIVYPWPNQRNPLKSRFPLLRNETKFQEADYFLPEKERGPNSSV
jgi:hypothetical protein